MERTKRKRGKHILLNHPAPLLPLLLPTEAVSNNSVPTTESKKRRDCTHTDTYIDDLSINGLDQPKLDNHKLFRKEEREDRISLAVLASKRRLLTFGYAPLFTMIYRKRSIEETETYRC